MSSFPCLSMARNKYSTQIQLALVVACMLTFASCFAHFWRRADFTHFHLRKILKSCHGIVLFESVHSCFPAKAANMHFCRRQRTNKHSIGKSRAISLLLASQRLHVGISSASCTCKTCFFRLVLPCIWHAGHLVRIGTSRAALTTVQDLVLLSLLCPPRLHPRTCAQATRAKKSVQKLWS